MRAFNVRVFSTVTVALACFACREAGRPDSLADDSSGVASDDHGADGSTGGRPPETTNGTAPADDDGPAADDDGVAFDLGAAGSSSDDGAPDEGPATCVDTTADAVLLFSPCAGSVSFAPEFADDYACSEYVSLPGVMSYDGNTTFAYDDPDLLLVSGWAGGMVQIRVTRDAHCHITGFADPEAVPWSATELGDVTVRGMTWGDDGTMFLLRSVPMAPHQLGQRSPGAVTTTKLSDPMTLLPMWPDMLYDNPTVAITVVPAGFPGAGGLKLVAETENTATWFTLGLAADGEGTYDVVDATEETAISPPDDGWGGYFARGVAYIDAGNPEIDVPSVFITDAWAYELGLYELDDDGDPILDTRRLFADGYGLGIPSGANRDAVSHDVIVTGYRSNRLVVIRGFSGGGGGDPEPDPDPRG